MRHPASPHFIALVLMLGVWTWTPHAWAAAPDLFERAHISQPYATHPAVKQAQEKGLTSSVWEALDEPQSAMALRAAIVDALARGGHGSAALKRYTLKLVYSKKRTLNDLQTHQLFTLGWMRARVQANGFGATKGKHEIQRADPVLMLNAASNRMRGELSIGMIDALVKAQRALNTPKEVICTPHDCVDNVLKNHQTHWSLHPTAMCNIVKAVSLPKRPKPKIGTKLCDMIQRQDARAPVHHTTSSTPAVAAHKRFSAQPPTAPGQLILPGIGNLAGVNLTQLNASGQLPPEFVKIMMLMQQQAIQSIKGVHSTGRKGGTSKQITLDPKALKATFKGIIIQSGDTKRAPQVGRVIELKPPKDPDTTP